MEKSIKVELDANERAILVDALADYQDTVSEYGNDLPDQDKVLEDVENLLKKIGFNG